MVKKEEQNKIWNEFVSTVEENLHNSGSIGDTWTIMKVCRTQLVMTSLNPKNTMCKEVIVSLSLCVSCLTRRGGLFTDSQVLCKSWFGNFLPVIPRSCWGLSKTPVVHIVPICPQNMNRREKFLKVIKRSKSVQELDALKHSPGVHN